MDGVSRLHRVDYGVDDLRLSGVLADDRGEDFPGPEPRRAGEGINEDVQARKKDSAKGRRYEFAVDRQLYY